MFPSVVALEVVAVVGVAVVVVMGNFPLVNTSIRYHPRHHRFMRWFQIFLKSSKFLLDDVDAGPLIVNFFRTCTSYLYWNDQTIIYYISMDPAHDPVEGMIGMEVLEQFDVDFDFPAGRLRLWKPHSVESVARKAGMLTIDALVVNETRLLGFRVVPSKPTSATLQKGGGSGTTVVAAQPFLGVVDCGASFSVINWAAAPLLGLPPQNDNSYDKRPKVVGLGVDGQPQLLPTATVGLSYCGNPIVSKDNKSMAFEGPPSEWKPWSEINVAVGDLPVFTQLLGDGITPYRGPAGVIGLDILSQRRLILETSASRQRRIYVGRG
jgi:hypothetical protein